MLTFFFGVVLALFCSASGFGFTWEKGEYKREAGKVYNILLLGKSGHDKRSLGNHLLFKEEFDLSPSAKSVTKKVQKKSGSIGDTPIAVVNTPGVSDTAPGGSSSVKELTEAVLECPEGYDAFLLVFNPNVRITEEEKHAIKRLQFVFGEHFFQYVIFVFTHKDDFEQRNNYLIEKYIAGLDDEMKTYFSKAGRRYVFLNTEADSLRERRMTNIKVLQLLEDIDKTSGGARYTNYIFKAAAGVGIVGSLQTYTFSLPIGFCDQHQLGNWLFSLIYCMFCYVLYYSPFRCIANVDNGKAISMEIPK